MFKCIFLNENVWITIIISLKFVPKGSINNNPALFQIMAWRRPGDKPLSEPMMVSLLTHICVTLPQWVKQCWLWEIKIMRKNKVSPVVSCPRPRKIYISITVQPFTYISDMLSILGKVDWLVAIAQHNPVRNLCRGLSHSVPPLLKCHVVSCWAWLPRKMCYL